MSHLGSVGERDLGTAADDVRSAVHATRVHRALGVSSGHGSGETERNEVMGRGRRAEWNRRLLSLESITSEGPRGQPPARIYPN